jgi:LDH2 family malate/lactate/ureidoglycolate dehydrogenase
MIEPRFRPADLADHGAALLVAAGLAGDRARVIASILVEADLMGHTTHGLALLPGYLEELAQGSMALAGEPSVIRDTGPCLTWDGRRLPGVWLTARAIDTALPRARRYGTATVVIRRSHHIACLGAFLTRATDQGCMILLATSDPADASVAPFGGVTPVFTPDPIGVGIPTPGDPILIDTSASITTNGMSARLRREGRRFPHAWLQDAAGTPSDDPNVLVAEPPGTIQPTGGLDHGHKGYALALMVEALTMGLGGFGRADPAEGWGASVFVQVIDPDAFAGADAFRRETGWTGEACRAATPRPGVERVRLPGDAALERRRRGLAEGVTLHPGIMDGLAGWAEKLGVAPFSNPAWPGAPSR